MTQLRNIGIIQVGLGALLVATACSSSDGSSGSGVGTGGGSATGGSGQTTGGQPGGGTGGTTSVGGTTSTGGTTSVGGTTSTGGAGTGGSTVKPPCIADPAQNAGIIGDSYVTGALSPALQPALAALFAPAGSYPNNAVPGASMATGGLPVPKIPAQFTSLITAHPNVKLGIMDGGGNDILICDGVTYPNCATLCNTTGSSTQQVCKDIVNQAITTAGTLMQTAATAGLKDVIYFFYPHIPANSGGYKEILDYAEPMAKSLCDNASSATSGKLNCYFVDLVQPFIAAGGDMNPANFAADGIHPSQTGQNIIAQEIYNVMQAQCLGQATTSSCCAP